MEHNQEKSRLEEEKRAEADRLAAEREALERFQMSTRLTTDRALQRDLHGKPESATSSVVESESDADYKKRGRVNESPDSKKKKNKKKKGDTGCAQEEEEEEEDREEDALSDLQNLLERMKIWMMQPGVAGKVHKVQSEKFWKYLDRMQDGIGKARLQKAVIETRIEEQRTLVNIVRNTVQEELEKVKITSTATSIETSYADALKKVNPQVPPVSGVRGPVKQAPKLVIVRQAEKESEEVTATLKRLVNPQEINVKKIVKIKNGVIVEAENEEYAEKLMNKEVLKEAGLNIERPTKKKPVIIVYDVSADLNDDNIKEQVYYKNMRESQIPEGEFQQEFEIKRKYKNVQSGGKKGNIIVECSVRVRNFLRGKERIFINWESCKVKDYVDVVRCFKCQRYGHVAKYCTSEKSSCSHCAGDHDFKDCPDKDKREKLCCVNCKRDKRENNKHEVRSRKCPAFEKAVKRLNEKIDYGV